MSGKIIQRMTIIAGLVLSVALPTPSALAQTVTSEELSTLKQGNVVVGQVTEVNNMPTVSAKILIPEPPDKVWKTVTDPNALMSEEEKVQKIKTVADTGSTKDVEFTVLMVRFLPAFRYILRHQPVGDNTLTFRRLSGSFKDIRGFWKLAPADGGKNTVLIYNLSIDPGPLVPESLLMQAVKSDLPRMMQNVKSAIQSH